MKSSALSKQKKMIHNPEINRNIFSKVDLKVLSLIQNSSIHLGELHSGSLDNETTKMKVNLCFVHTK